MLKKPEESISWNAENNRHGCPMNSEQRQKKKQPYNNRSFILHFAFFSPGEKKRMGRRVGHTTRAYYVSLHCTSWGSLVMSPHGLLHRRDSSRILILRYDCNGNRCLLFSSQQRGYGAWLSLQLAWSFETRQFLRRASMRKIKITRFNLSGKRSKEQKQPRNVVSFPCRKAFTSLTSRIVRKKLTRTNIEAPVLIAPSNTFL